jgi:hypothetical protein
MRNVGRGRKLSVKTGAGAISAMRGDRMVALS